MITADDGVFGSSMIQIDNMGKFLKEGMDVMLSDIADEIYNGSKENCPVITGNLRESAYCVSKTNNNIDAVFSDTRKDAPKLSSDHVEVVSKAENWVSSAGVGESRAEVGHSAYYALFPHEGIYNGFGRTAHKYLQRAVHDSLKSIKYKIEDLDI